MAWDIDDNQLFELAIVKNGRKIVDQELKAAILAAREVVCNKANAVVVPMYNKIEDALDIDDIDERMLCDEIAYQKLYNTAWTCELIRKGYRIRVLDEIIFPKEYRGKHDWRYRFIKPKYGLIQITIEDI